MLDVIDASLGYVTERGSIHVVTAPLNFSLGARGVLGLAGPSGIGKTTVLRTVAGLLAPLSGEVRQHFDEIDETRPVAWFAPQAPVLLAFRTVLQNALFGKEVTEGLAEPDLIGARELLGTLGLQEAIDAYPSQLSGGMRRRVALAQGLLSARSLLLIDEPLAEIDYNTRLVVEQVIRSHVIATAGACLIASHDVDSLVALADEILVLQGPAPAHAVRISVTSGPNALEGAPRERRRRSDFSKMVAKVQRAQWEQVGA